MIPVLGKARASASPDSAGLFEYQGRVNHARLNPVGRLAGNMYCRTDGVYELVRPSYNPENG